VLFGYILLGEVYIVAHHVQCRMAENLLQAEDIAAAADVLDGEGVPLMPSSA